MTARFGSLGTQYFTDDNVVLGGGSVTFYEPGTTTLKNTYSDSAMTIENTNPVLLDAAGRLPNVFFSGLAKAVLKDSEGEIIETRDPVGDFTEGNAAFSTWSVDVSYPTNAVVAGSDGYFYVSQENNNIANDPTISPTKWKLLVEQLGFDGTNNGNVYVVDTADPQGIGNVTVTSIRVLVPILTVSASAAATVDFTGITSAFDEYELHALNASPATDNVTLRMRTSSNAGVSYDSGGSDYAYNTAGSPATTDHILLTTAIGNDGANEPGASFVMTLVRPSDNTRSKSFWWNHVQVSPTTVIGGSVSVGQRLSSSAVNAVRLYMSSGNIQSGIFTLYGVRRT